MKHYIIIAQVAVQDDGPGPSTLSREVQHALQTQDAKDVGIESVEVTTINAAHTP